MQNTDWLATVISVHRRRWDASRVLRGWHGCDSVLLRNSPCKTLLIDCAADVHRRWHAPRILRGRHGLVHV